MSTDFNKYNVGVAACKFLMALVVVWFHFGVPFKGCKLAVPVFMTLSFILVGSEYDLGKRILRVMYPFWAWSAIGILVHVFLHGKVSAQSVLLQFTLGHSYAQHLWFLPVMAMCCAVVSLLLAGRCKFILSSLVVGVIFVIEQSGLNYSVLSRYSAEVSYPLGRFVEMLPYAVGGCVLGDCIRGKCGRNLLLWLGIGCLSFVLGIVVGLVVSGPLGFGYGGIGVFLCAVGVCLIFYSVGRIVTRSVNSVILKYCSALFSTSACIYYCHHSVGSIIRGGGLLFFAMVSWNCCLRNVVNFRLFIVPDKMAEQNCQIRT